MPGRGRASDFDDRAFLAAVEGDERLAIQVLANNFNVDHSTIVRRHKKLGKMFLKNLVTDDESWLLFKNLKRKKVCVWPRVSPKGITKNLHCKKAMWCVWWDRSGITHWEIIFSGIFYSWNGEDEHQQWRILDKKGKRQFNINNDVYLAQLDSLHAEIT
ncbi:Histone-lysine N-methyltransferase SETMAR like protein [Argiope bruennichi]|uniref:Histone-lysine N-methyltransferase SETMAR like protein n=1 Tax=Argiope bruennichi TaxID=94029 RepID=A0A8T0EFG1_ARGBR|nr:Histone-lysine N-methyltransferase SETMAR like protein [Argiope bruennichi]